MQTSIPILSVCFMAVSALISIGLPIALFVVFRKLYDAKAVPLLFGAAGFVVFALILEQFVHSRVFAAFPLAQMPAAYIVYGVLAAGVFEETARFLSFEILKRKYDDIGSGLAYGIGHGGVEAVLLVGVSMISAAVLSLAINAGGAESMLAGLPAETADGVNAQITALLTTPSYLFLNGGIERIFAMGLQIALSVIVFYAVHAENKRWLYPLAILLHAIADIPAAAMQVGLIKNMYVTELLVCAAAILLLFLARYVHLQLRHC